MKRIVSLFLVLITVLSMAACTVSGSKLAAPTNVEASMLNGSVLITWDPVENANSYEITVGDTSYTTQQNLYLVKGPITADFTYSVIAVADGYRSSDASGLQTFSLAGLQLATPTDLSITASGVITWTAVPNAAFYEVTVGNQPAVSVTTTSYQVTSVESDFTFRVVAVAEGFQSSPEATGSFSASSAQKLSAPSSVTVSNNGLISWSAVPNATSYVVSFSGKSYTTSINFYQAPPFAISVPVSVTAQATGYRSSDPTTVDSGASVAIAINGASEIRSGNTVTLTATVSNALNQIVYWSIEEGGEFATIDRYSGVLTAKEVDGDKILKVVATSEADGTVSAAKIITVTAAPKLTQSMLDALAEQNVIGFEGYVNINLYTIGLFEHFYQTYTTVVKTAMDGSNWYAEYENGDTGTVQGIYFKNVDGYANSIGVSFMNEEEYEPMLDDNGRRISWSASGLYNNFPGLKVSDFTFNNETWRYEYTGNDVSLLDRMVASANPYEFVPVSFSLIIDGDEIIGIYAESDSDYTILEGYRAVQELTVLINCGDTVDVKTIGKYTHDPLHDYLNRAVEKMQETDSYTVDYLNLGYSYLTSSVDVTGFVETVTGTDCYYRPFEEPNWYYQDESRVFSDSPYGYHRVSDTLYNAYIYSDGKYVATRAYAGDVSQTRPSFAFAAEIFTRIAYTLDENGNYETITYYADDVMSGVASTFYYGLGNDIALYGIFASSGMDSNGERFTPFVTVDVKTGYITEACFYYYLGYLYGYTFISYGDFNEAALPDEVEFNDETFISRQIPTTWDELTIIASFDSTGTADDQEVNAQVFLEHFCGASLAQTVPFIGNVLGDTYGFGMTTSRLTGAKRSVPAIVFYYDVPLDTNYTIDSSLKKIAGYLLERGFVKNRYGEYEKNGLVIEPVDNSLDLLVYLWVDHLTSWDQEQIRLNIPYDADTATEQSVRESTVSYLTGLTGSAEIAGQVSFTISSETVNNRKQFTVTMIALDYMRLFFTDASLAEQIPFFHTVNGLGDTAFRYGEVAEEEGQPSKLLFHYEQIPDAGHTVASLGTAMREYLLNLGFAADPEDSAGGRYRKDGLAVLYEIEEVSTLMGPRLEITVSVWEEA